MRTSQTLRANRAEIAGNEPPTLDPQAEVPFAFHEIFFSRTDGRGIIKAGNAVFQRVSGHESARLVGAPHNIIRHPVMPKAVFHLLWARINAGQATGAYVCNRARDGRHYWVFAVVVPVREGFLSVRIKPQAATFDRARALYADLWRGEAAGRSIGDSAAAALAALSAEGFPAYHSFQAQAIAAEVIARAERIGRPRPDIGPAIAAARAADLLGEELQAMRHMFRGALRIATNLRILTAQLGHRGRPLGAVAENYATLCDGMTGWIESQSGDSGFGGLARSASDNLFLGNAAALLDEMAENFANDREAGVSDPHGELERLTEAAADYRARAEECRVRADRDIAGLGSHLSQMRHQVTRLDAIRMLCRVEGERLRTGEGSLDQIVLQLDRFQDELGLRLTRMMALGQEIERAGDVFRV